MIETGIDTNHPHNLDRTAVMETIILNEGKSRHQAIVRLFIEGGSRADTPTEAVDATGTCEEIVAMLEAAVRCADGKT